MRSSKIASLGKVFGALRRPTSVESVAASDFLARAHALANTGRHEEAVDVLEAGLADHPGHMQAHEILIQVLVHLQRYEQALDACARALELDAKSNSVLASLNVILPTVRNTKHPEDVIRSLNRCAAVAPQNFDVVILLIDLLQKTNRFQDTVQACELALKLDPEFLPAFEIIEKITKDPAAQSERRGTQPAEMILIPDDYSRVVAENVADFLGHVMTTFYRKLGVDPQAVPLVQGLDRFRRKMSLSQGEVQTRPAGVLISFERAWSEFQAGRVDESLPLFEAIFRDPSARKKAAFNPYIKQAVVRSGEILGRRYDNNGSIDLAISVYREIMTLDHNSIIAGRLLVLLARGGNLRAAAKLAEDAIVSRTNLYPRLFESSYIASLKEQISRP